MEILLCVIYKLTEAAAKEEQFKDVNVQVIEKNLPSFQLIGFHCSLKAKLYSSTQTWLCLSKLSIARFFQLRCDEPNEV